ncbi:endo-1,3 [Panicum miliaceum]|uniref:Endo-1,3 n=1 Tax=Panicum miliaceum TaxID=4540 RepID=A0A3L6R8V4_PANMI|nr:endo-1,3 [Panicum miliaceum]
MASPHCFENPPALVPACGGREVVDDFGGQKAYVAGSAEAKVAVVLVSDAFGFEAPKLREIADKVVSDGYFVVVPDFLHGDPYEPNNPNPLQWLQSHDPEKAFEEAKPVIAALKEKGMSTIGAAGYCWGAKVVAELAKAPEIQAAVMSHPSLVTVDDIKEVRCPICVLGAEIDQLSPPELVKQFEQVLSANSAASIIFGNLIYDPRVAHFVKIFPGVTHGWAVRYSDDDEAAVKSAEEAFADMTGWYDKHLK